MASPVPAEIAIFIINFNVSEVKNFLLYFSAQESETYFSAWLSSMESGSNFFSSFTKNRTFSKYPPSTLLISMIFYWLREALAIPPNYLFYTKYSFWLFARFIPFYWKMFYTKCIWIVRAMLKTRLKKLKTCSYKYH